MAIGNRYGFRSGKITAKAIECRGDLTIQDDIVFSDVSAGRLGVTGGIDMSGTTSAIGIDMSGGTFSAAAIRIGDDSNLVFGAGNDVTFEYDENGTNVLRVTGAAINFAQQLQLAQLGGAVSSSGLLMGTGTTVSPATTSTADAKFVELRCQTTATSGDNRLLYMRYDINGTTGGECLRAFTKITAAATTARGGHVSLDVASAGSCSGLGIGIDGQILVHNGVLSGGTYAVLNSEIYSAGSSSDVSGVTEISFLRLSLGGDSTGAANVDDNAFLFSLSGGSVASGNIVEADTDETKFSHKIRIQAHGTTYYLMATAT